MLELKLCPSVVFAGVDSPEDITGHMYQELFHSGGFVVSDNKVLESVALGESRRCLSWEQTRSGSSRPSPSRSFCWCPWLLLSAGAFHSLPLTAQTHLDRGSRSGLPKTAGSTTMVRGWSGAHTRTFSLEEGEQRRNLVSTPSWDVAEKPVPRSSQRHAGVGQEVTGTSHTYPLHAEGRNSR